MDACAKIVVDKGNTNGGNLSILNSTIASCDTWQGIEVVGDNVGWVTTVHQATSASLIMYNTDLHDAMTGIYVHDYGYIYILIEGSPLSPNPPHVAPSPLPRWRGTGIPRQYVAATAEIRPAGAI